MSQASTTSRRAVAIAFALLLLTWAGFGASAGTAAPGSSIQSVEASDSVAPSTTLFSRVSKGLHSIRPFAASTVPASATPVVDGPVAREKGAEVVPEARRVPTTIRRGTPFRLAEEVAPRGIQVMRVPVPATLAGRDAVDWTVRAEPTVNLLSATAGSVPRDALSEARSATVVVRVPASATAGILSIGEATFVTETDAVVVPLELVVARIRRATVTSLRPSFAAVSGQRGALGFEVHNAGNGVDTFAVQLETPSTWRVTSVPVMVLRPGERRRVEVDFNIPAVFGSTAVYPQVKVYASGNEIATTTLFMNVASESESDRKPGPDLGIGAASVLGDSTGAAPVFALDLRGPVGRGIMLNGRAAIATDPSDINYVGLSRAGVFMGGAYLNATAPGWNATIGTTGATVSDLSGIGVYGIGASGGVTTGSVRTSAMMVNSQQGDAISAGGRVEKSLGSAMVGVVGSHLEDGFLVGRTLDAVGIVGSATPLPGMKLNGEVAYRSFTGGQGVGVYASAQRATEHGFFGISAGHAPGGSTAYARALNEVTASASHRITNRLAIRADAFTSADKPPTGGNFKSTGFTVAPAFAFGRTMTLETELRRNDYTSASQGRGFGNGETQLNGTLRGMLGRTRWAAGANYATGSRTSVDASLGLNSDQGYRRAGVTGGLGWSFQRLVLDVGADYTRSEVASGYFPRQMRLAATASRIQVFRDPRLPMLAANLEYTTWFSSEQSAAVVARVGSEMNLTRDLSLLVDVERNPLIRPAGSPTPWVAAVRVQKSIRLGWAFSEPRTRGMVYQDINANGRRDADESGLGGVMVRRGTSTAITDNTGRYSFVGRDGNAPTIDPVSLPIGQVVGTDSGAKVKGSELAVIPTAPLTIKLTPVADSLGRLPVGNMDQVVILARDQSGNEWSLRADLEGVVRFDALPPGLYTLGADFSGSTERLRIAGEAPVIEVRPGVSLDVVTLRFQLRPLRVFNGASTGRTGR